MAIEGQRGRKAGDLKPFSQLKLQELQVELNARQIYTQGRKKDELEHNLKVILKGVQHVPTLLLLEPTASLTTLNLEKYTVLDCEPLHDVKGHFINLTKELPFLLQGEVRQSTESIISACVSDKMTCADHRVLLMQLYLHLKQAGVDNKIILLIQTAVQISRNLYLPCSRTKKPTKSPTAVQLYMASPRALPRTVHTVSCRHDQGENVRELPACTSCTCSNAI